MKQFYKYLVIVLATLYVGIFGVKIASSYFPFYQGQLGTGTATTGYVLTSTGTGANTVAQWSATPSGMVYPSGSGIPIVSSGTSWGTTITDNHANWDAGYSGRIATFTTTGSSGSASFSGNTLNIPTYTLAGLGGFALPALTSGSVLFSNGSTIAQDNANFFWDSTNHRLGIGTTSPGQALEVNGEIVQDAYTTSGTNAYGLAVNAPTGATHNYTAIFSGGNVGIGDAVPGTKLSVVGNATIGYASGQTAPSNGLIISGNVGIGTTSPTYRLDVAGSGASGTARFYDQTASTGATLVTITPGAAQTSASTILSVGGVASVVGLTFNGHACSLVAGVVTCP